MNEEIKAVADRLIGLREIMEVSVEEAAGVCGISIEQYQKYETGTVDIPVGILQSMSKKYGIDLGTLISGKEPHMHSYCLTKKDKGLSVDRRSDYKYQALAMGFKHAKASPFIVTVDPKMESEMHLNSHEGQEFNLVLKGTLFLSIGGKDLILNPGDSIYFDSTQPHGMRALNGEPARFLAIIF